MATIKQRNGIGAYLREFGAAMLAYTVILPVSIHIAEANPHAPWRIPVALAPVVPVVFVLWAVIRQVGRMDELQRQMQLEALVFAFSGAGLLTFGYGFLENVGLPRLSYLYVLPVMVALWGIGVGVAHSRYR